MKFEAASRKLWKPIAKKRANNLTWVKEINEYKAPIVF